MAVETGTPLTIWQGRNGEYSSTGVLTLADASGKLLADTSGTNLVDSGLVFNPTPQTVWTRDDSK